MEKLWRVTMKIDGEIKSEVVKAESMYEARQIVRRM